MSISVIQKASRPASRAAVRMYSCTLPKHGGMTPPMPPFKRSPRKWQTLQENHDATWDDGVAPELALDFDAPNVSSKEALYTWAGALSVFAVLYNVINWVTNGAKDKKPALDHATDNVQSDYANLEIVPVTE